MVFYIRQKTLIKSLFLLFILTGFVSGCQNGNVEQKKVFSMKTDTEELAKLINVPEGTISSEWQTSEFPSGSDWWLAAILTVEPEALSSILQDPEGESYIESPPGIRLESSFKNVMGLSGATSSSENQFSITAIDYSATPFAKSPLNNGHVLQLSEQEIMVILFTM